MVTPFILHNSAVDENDVQKKPDAVPQSSSLLILVGVENSDADVFIVTSENSIENINNGGTGMYMTITLPLRYSSTVSTCTLCLLLIR